MGQFMLEGDRIMGKKYKNHAEELIMEPFIIDNPKTVERLFESAKKTINTFLNNYYDDSVAQINTYYLREFEKSDDIEVLRENINKVTIDEVINLNKKISLSCIYMLKGENND